MNLEDQSDMLEPLYEHDLPCNDITSRDGMVTKLKDSINKVREKQEEIIDVINSLVHRLEMLDPR